MFVFENRIVCIVVWNIKPEVSLTELFWLQICWAHYEYYYVDQPWEIYFHIVHLNCVTPGLSFHLPYKKACRSKFKVVEIRQSCSLSYFFFYRVFLKCRSCKIADPLPQPHTHRTRNHFAGKKNENNITISGRGKMFLTSGFSIAFFLKDLFEIFWRMSVCGILNTV